MFTQPPTSDLCAFGEPTAVLGNGPWTWACQGIAGGQDAPCSAGYQPPADVLFGDRFETEGETGSAQLNRWAGAARVPTTPQYSKSLAKMRSSPGSRATAVRATPPISEK